MLVGLISIERAIANATFLCFTMAGAEEAFYKVSCWRSGLKLLQYCKDLMSDFS
jgi:hypothetical protein